MKNYYDILGVKQNATSEEIRIAYRKLSLKFHPDKNNGDEFLQEMYKNVVEANEILSNKERRQEYDKNMSFKSSSSSNNFQNSNNNYQKNDAILLQKVTEYISKQNDVISARIKLDKAHDRKRYRNNYMSFPKFFGLLFLMFILYIIFVSRASSSDTYSNISTNSIDSASTNSHNNEIPKQKVEIPSYAEKTETKYKVISEKAYFYYSPVSPDDIQEKYLVLGDEIQAKYICSGYIYCVYKKTKGWINIYDLEEKIDEFIPQKIEEQDESQEEKTNETNEQNVETTN